MAATRRTLPAALAKHQWQPGQSGNPSGQSGEYGKAIRLARQAAPDAVRRLIELTQSADERVAAVACNAILDRAFGKPQEYNPPETSLDDLSDDELRRQVVERLVKGGLSENVARAFADGDLKPHPPSISADNRTAGRHRKGGVPGALRRGYT